VFGRRAYFIRIALVLYILAGCLALLDPHFFIDDDAQRVVLCVEYIVFGLILVACGSGTIAKERQGRTLGLLLSTPLEPWNILLGKIAGVLRRALLVLLLMVGHIFVLGHLTVLSGEECLYCLANALVFGAFFLAIAMASSAYWKSTSRATLGALFISFGILIVPIIVCVLIEIGFGPRSARELTDFVLGFSPGYWIAAMMQRHGRPETGRYVTALVMYGIVAAVLFWICGRRFRKLAAEA